MMAECHPGFHAAADCRRLRPRKGTAAVLDLDWMDTSDGFGGFKKLHYFPNGKLEVGKVYEAPAGWHWGSKAEVAAIMGGGKAREQPEKRYYWDQDGWVECTWGGVRRECFFFSDSLAQACLGSGHFEGTIQTDLLPTKSWCFAGIVCVAN